MNKPGANDMACPFCHSDRTNSPDCRCSQCGRSFLITLKPGWPKRHAWFLFSGFALVLGFAAYPFLVPILDKMVLNWFAWVF